MRTNIVCKSLFIFMLLAWGGEARSENVTDYLRLFHQNPALMMERLPSVVDKHGVAHPSGFMNQEAIAASSPRRREALSKILNADLASIEAAIPEKNDSIEKLLDSGTTVERNIGAMQEPAFMNASAPIKPWADSYWPTYKGQLGWRYADKNFPDSKKWLTNFEYYQRNPAAAIVATGNPLLINMLSPAEKYDYVMGDSNFTLTQYSWNEGQKALDRDKAVATWMGICHGWAAAAHMGAFIVGNPVTVVSPTGVPVIFYPQDIKALQSMLWANGAPTSRFVGSKCLVDKPERNSNGRIIDPDCLNTNPATWHLAIVNQLGKNHRAFVFDGTYDAEIWNFPISSTRFRYFHPQTLEEKRDWRNATIPLSAYRLDKFREFRSPDAVSVVGVYMDVTYVIEIDPGISRVFDAPPKPCAIFTILSWMRIIMWWAENGIPMLIQILSGPSIVARKPWLEMRMCH